MYIHHYGLTSFSQKDISTVSHRKYGASWINARNMHVL